MARVSARKSEQVSANAHAGDVMPHTLDHPTGTARYAPAPVRVRPEPLEEEEMPVLSERKDSPEKDKKSWPLIILASGGTGAASAILAGSIVGPLGALGAGVFGILLGILIQKPQKSKMQAHR